MREEGARNEVDEKRNEQRERAASRSSREAPKEGVEHAPLTSVKRYVRRHPGRSFGLSILAGALAARLVASPHRNASTPPNGEGTGGKPFFLSHMILALVSAAAEEAIRRRMREGPSREESSLPH